MSNLKSFIGSKSLRWMAFLLLGVQLAWAPSAIAQTTVSLAQVPLLALKSAPGLVMLNMSRDHRLFYAAYTDTADIDGDGIVDVGFKSNITYYGNFVSDRCYDYITSGGNTPLFRPVAIAATSGCKSSTGTRRWHGNWLNWAATSRMDALRRVLYGGYRVVDTSAATVLQGAYIPKDSHVWGKEFRPGRDTYDITQYADLPTPALNKQHLFTVVSPTTNTGYPFISTTVAPVLRYITDADQTTERIWFWASADVAQGIASTPANFTKGGGRTSVAATDRVLKVEACIAIGTPAARESGCTGYPTASPTIWKPTGLLHDYSSTDSLKFGLLTGSYENNYSGGVVRRNIRSFKDEITAATGVFSDNAGIARTIDRITIHGWNGSQYDCGYKTDGDRPQGTCRSWGAPIAEMMYEGLRFFSGKGTGTAAYTANVGAGADNTMGFSAPVTWQNPYQSKTQATTGATYGNPICSRPVQMVIADPLTSFDSDQLPGAYFSPATGFGTALGATDLTGLNVQTEASAIWTAESLGTRNVFIGQSGTTRDGNPTPKSASSFAALRGHAPDQTRAEGSYYSASVARFARTTGVPIGNPTGSPAVPTVAGQAVDSLVVALGSLTPRIEIPNGAGGKVTIVPISKAVGGAGINKNPANYQATGAITGFYFAEYTATSIKAVVNFSDADQGTDNETDAQALYEITVVGSSITIKMSQLDKYPGGIESHMGYVISGTNTDGMYLEMRTSKAGSGNVIPAGDVYYLDTLPGQSPNTTTTQRNGNATAAVAAAYTSTYPQVFAGQFDAISNNSCPAYDPVTPPAGGDGPASVIRPYGVNVATPALGSAGSTRPNQRAWKVNQVAALDSCLPTWADKTTPNAQTSRTFTMSAVASTTGYIPNDTLWYAAKYGGAGVLDANGDPTNYFRVTNPAKMPEQMGKAFRAAAALAAVASTSVVGVGQRNLGNAAIYQANYDSLTWSSRLYAFAVSTTGAVSNTEQWEAASLLRPPATRTNLFLGRGGTTAPFALVTGAFALLNSAEQTDFGNSDTYEYLLGDKTKEERKGGALRNRGTTAGTEFGSVLGDIVNSDPQIVTKKDYGYTASDASYTSFLATLTNESLAVGANDGFFHIFNALPKLPAPDAARPAEPFDVNSGKELFAFMPQAARSGIKDLASPAYSHRFFVDGSIGLGHAKIALPGDPTVNWRSLVVGTGGAGAKTVFAIHTPNDQIYTANNLMWEINENTTFPNDTNGVASVGRLGNVIGRPAIGKLKNGVWVTVFGNGYNSTSGFANLIVANMATGAILAVVPTNSAITANGLGSTEIVNKTTGDKDTIEYVYAADYKGNIWRFDLTSVTAGNTGWPTTAALVYKTPVNRPITAEIKIGPATGNASIVGGKMVYFGTGSYLNTGDVNTTPPTQALYGIFDDLLGTSNTTASVAESALEAMAISMAATNSDVRTTTVVTTPWYTITGKKGWVVPFSGTNVAAGERVIAPPVRFTVTGKVDAFLFTSIVPATDDCVAGLDAWVTAVDAMTGSFALAFNSIPQNSIKVTGGSPRGVFILDDTTQPALYISQTIFNGNVSTTSYTTESGGQRQVTINGVTGETRLIKVDLSPKGPPPAATGAPARQSWRQLK